ncbi:hypothetical protein [Telluribacter sp. SYSU D00476]|uniref:hypothetical protein n=1 Tax=Telluribacter sp. SYSU D00476 TaxID=2811430 RepID=UPI001FF4CE28|nr:hypothetical protein [Telluribacter sp. SYSU D00476]
MATTTEDLKNKAADLKSKADSFNPEHKEGPVAAAIEDYTARLPSDTYLWAAIGSMALSATLKLAGQDKGALFVGQWAPTFLILGLYNKLVKMEGFDKDK